MHLRTDLLQLYTSGDTSEKMLPSLFTLLLVFSVTKQQEFVVSHSPKPAWGLGPRDGGPNVRLRSGKNQTKPPSQSADQYLHEQECTTSAAPHAHTHTSVPSIRGGALFLTGNVAATATAGHRFFFLPTNVPPRAEARALVSEGSFCPAPRLARRSPPIE